jgi:hypothetical protein
VLALLYMVCFVSVMLYYIRVWIVINLCWSFYMVCSVSVVFYYIRVWIVINLWWLFYMVCSDPNTDIKQYKWNRTHHIKGPTQVNYNPNTDIIQHHCLWWLFYMVCSVSLVLFYIRVWIVIILCWSFYMVCSLSVVLYTDIVQHNWNKTHHI